MPTSILVTFLSIDAIVMSYTYVTQPITSTTPSTSPIRYMYYFNNNNRGVTSTFQHTSTHTHNNTLFNTYLQCSPCMNFYLYLLLVGRLLFTIISFIYIYVQYTIQNVLLPKTSIEKWASVTRFKIVYTITYIWLLCWNICSFHVRVVLYCISSIRWSCCFLYRIHSLVVNCYHIQWFSESCVCFVLTVYIALCYS